MRDNKEVLMVLYDNPTVTGKERRQADLFRKKVRHMGFVELQKSVYVRIIRSRGTRNVKIDQLKRVAPKNGNVKCLTIPLSIFKKW